MENAHDMAHDGRRQSAELLRTKQLALVGICQDIIYQNFHTIDIAKQHSIVYTDMNVASLYNVPFSSTPCPSPALIPSGPLILSTAGLNHCGATPVSPHENRIKQDKPDKCTVSSLQRS